MKISEEVGSKYRFIVLAGQRVAQLQKGARPRVENADKLKMTQIAVQELEQDLIQFKKIDLEAQDQEDAEATTEETKGDSASE